MGDRGIMDDKCGFHFNHSLRKEAITHPLNHVLISKDLKDNSMLENNFFSFSNIPCLHDMLH